jgi:hypothetical protein
VEIGGNLLLRHEASSRDALHRFAQNPQLLLQQQESSFCVFCASKNLVLSLVVMMNAVNLWKAQQLALASEHCVT